MLARQAGGAVGAGRAGNREAQDAVDRIHLHLGKAAAFQRLRADAQLVQAGREFLRAPIVVFRQAAHGVGDQVQAVDVGMQRVVAVAIAGGVDANDDAHHDQRQDAEHGKQELARAGDRGSPGDGCVHCARVRFARDHVRARQGVVHGAFAEDHLLQMVEQAGQQHVHRVLHGMAP
ncbi:hypothetical protein D3C87_1663830 [compost metagenome]